jgi:hypothetical protein
MAQIDLKIPTHIRAWVFSSNKKMMLNVNRYYLKRKI